MQTAERQIPSMTKTETHLRHYPQSLIFFSQYSVKQDVMERKFYNYFD